MRRAITLGAATAVVAGAVLVGVSVAGLSGDRRVPSSFGTITPPSPAGGSLSSTPTPPHPRPAPVSTTSSPAPSRPSALDVPAVSFILRLPTLGVSAAVLQVVTQDGVLGVPDDPAELGWWIGSPPPGSAAGTTVIDGHVDSAVSGPGALFRLGELHPGDPVQITLAGGHRVAYQVTARSVYVKSAGLPAGLFASTGSPRLVLISCGGPFDEQARSYLDNIVVAATPIA